MKCRFCHSLDVVKSGHVRNKQRYKCKECKKNYVTDITSRGMSLGIKMEAIRLLKEGMGLRGIGRILGVSATTVMVWVRNYASIIEEMIQENKVKNIEDIEVVELDEMWHYVKKTVQNMAYACC